MRSIVACIANFSEGRNRAVINQIISAIQSVPGVKILQFSMDKDHHRTVITFVGEKDTIGESAVRATQKATELINLTQHSGVHPRIGSTDVVPFVPISNVTMDDCINIAHKVGKQIYQRLSIPVYFYEAAAKQTRRRQLEHIRRGQFEELQVKVRTDASRLPDFGKSRLHPTAGATAVGARTFLIAYNIILNSSDILIAKKIATFIRFSSGGLPCLKAIGVNLKTKKKVQVSMNLTNFKVTSMEQVFNQVFYEANLLKTTIAYSEIIGLVPRKALTKNLASSLKIKFFHQNLIFENCLRRILETTNKV